MKVDEKKSVKLASKPLWHGVILVAGGAVGAGMFALPLVSSGAWFSWSTLGLAVVCMFTYLAATLLVSVNVRYPVGSSFDTLIRDTLGGVWVTANNLSIAFVMYILMYAYITAGAGILDSKLASMFDDGLEIHRSVLSVIFASVMALFIWFGTSAVSRLSTIFMIVMCVAFSTANSGLITSTDMSVLFDGDVGRVTYLWTALPVFVTAFACAGLVPSLSSHYDNQAARINLSVFLGLLLALLVYVVWLASTLGNISQEGFVEVAENGGGLAALVAVLQSRTDSSLINSSLTWFSHFAVITSFLSIGLGLAHFLVDRFNFKPTVIGRTKSVGLAFLPPLVASLIAPYGFVSAIAYAGIFVAFSFFIMPALMSRKLSLSENSSSLTWIAVLGFGVLIIILKLANVFVWLPSY